SRVHDAIPHYVKDAYKSGIMSINHRSEDFMQMSRKTISLLKQKLRIPKEYTVFFTTSATECWEIIAQSVFEKESLHFHNGAFGQKWFDYTKRLRRGAASLPFGLNDFPDHMLIPEQFSGIVCVTQNETSNGTQVTNAILKKIRQRSSDAIVAVDATSSMAGIRLEFRNADIWFASVQKCFGLPAGLGIMVCSPAALNRAALRNETAHYNSLTFMMDMMEKWQTPFTPNVLAIYLLMRVLEDSPAIDEAEDKIYSRYESWVEFMQERSAISHLISNQKVQSYTVIPVRAEEETVTSIKKEAKKAGILLGEGYGPFKPYTFRIANFPAISEKEIKTLKTFLKKY
ncbi:MAG TPA: aminotransferase class V-fold PLP-dependent enzyme, partial [Sphingobacteriaceae bacterium]